MRKSAENQGQRAPKVLHIVESLGRGAVETWLLQLLSRSRQAGQSLNWSFYCQLPDPGVNSQRARLLGATVDASPVTLSNTLVFLRSLRRKVRELRPDVVHMHHDVLSGLYLFALAGLTCRTIVHVHNRALVIPVSNSAKAGILLRVFLRMCLRADRIVANSRDTLKNFLRHRAPRAGRDLVHLCGTDASRFRDINVTMRQEIREKLGISGPTPVLVFAGRLVPEKNPVLVLEVLERLVSRGRNAMALFVGEGPLSEHLASMASQLRLAEHVRWVGYQTDIAPYLCAGDVFMLASHDSPGEGFGLSVVEAQLSGLPVLVSSGVPSEPLIAGARHARLSSTDSVERYADAAEALLETGWRDPTKILENFQYSELTIDHSLAQLVALHRGLIA